MKKLFSLLTLLLLLCTSAWGETETLEASSSAPSISKGGTYVNVTLPEGKKFSSNTIKLTTSDCYNFTITVKDASTYYLKEIVFGNGNSSWTGLTSNGESSTVTKSNPGSNTNRFVWSSTSKTNSSVTFTPTVSSQVNINYIKVTVGSLLPSISSSNVDISATTTSGNISYTIENPVTGGAVTAAKKTEADWLNLGEVSASSVAFTTTGPNTGAERSATVTLTYTYNTNKTTTKDVVITQAVPTFTIAKGSHSNGDIIISKTSAAAGEVITLSATPDLRYIFSSWNVYKTGEQATTITVTNNTFTMPAYAVTVDATFNTDSRKQILYLTSTNVETTKTNDKLYAALNSVVDYNVIVEAPSSQVPTDYDLVVLHESLDGGTYYNNAVVAAAKNGNVPVLNTKSYFYTSARWNWGTPNAGQTEKVATLNTAYSNIEDHPIFAGLTITSNQIEVVGTAAAKAMQPIGSFISGYEGYTLATTSNASEGQGTAIHELTPAQRGVASAKYLMISVSNAKLNDLSDDGQLLFKNAAAYLMSDDSWIPNKVSGKISACGWASFSSIYALDLSDIDGGTAYYASAASGSTVTLAPTGDVTVPAGEGLMIKGSAGETFTIDIAASGTAISGNLLKGQTTTGNVAASPASGAGTYHYVFGFKKPAEEVTEYGFYNLASDTQVPAGKAYLETTTALTEQNAPAIIRILDEENNATSFERIDGKNDAIKFIENGQLYILREGVVYDALGRKVR